MSYCGCSGQEIRSICALTECIRSPEWSKTTQKILHPHVDLYIGPLGLRITMTQKSCYVTTIHIGACLSCGVWRKSMHLPIGRIGHFCRECCPECNRASKDQLTRQYRLTAAGRKAVSHSQ